ncbi:Zinc/manganese transport system substrate-binding protein [Bosea sp. 62]|uniref:metal ABC transporter substrate-binding protein n=1 Tax=unclassified Bosea (in: a-proteobacteria) TaxID=2653178 RepID=UPI0012558E24|nr:MULTISPECIES: metal ABC transporter substrate-binding protein [unclassified Bosea (in: a-proteobacteria)]CAD5250446.1 Zinc/manganese transport system substrate-binding protein [Bosea sp. 7B]CAD5281645.1 Zinc/manganese transport system substrate-binding protein [Bosea sp. 21B]CAD5283310.1 Zinc/manganese transport system substrate-binding protein [Bosea sp. 46]VVT52429.1 Zinc/manganese transport system substrate-binding protein [Bosea sp. EC-HK365B]VXB23654.1 Zinc/manganese transport system s
MLNRRSVLLGLAAGVALPLPAFAQEKLPVVASFSILGDFVREIGGDRVAVTTLVGPDGDAHVYSPTPADAKTVAGAKLVVVNGLKFEGWLTRLVKSSGTKATVATATTGITPLKMADDHGHGHGGEDPHAWQSVANAKLYVGNVRDALVAADPVGKAGYEANAAAYQTKLDALEAEIKAAVARIPADRRKAITSHDAFGYFVKAYGIAFIAPQGVSTEAEASAKDVARIIRQIKAEKVPAVFLENITNPRLAEQIAKESGAKIGGRLYSDALSAAGGPAGTYIAMMKHNISQIEKALVAGPA